MQETIGRRGQPDLWCLTEPRMVKDIVCEIEAAIVHLPDDTKDSIRTTTASILHRARLPPHSNTTKALRRSLRFAYTRVKNEYVLMAPLKGIISFT